MAFDKVRPGGSMNSSKTKIPSWRACRKRKELQAKKAVEAANDGTLGLQEERDSSTKRKRDKKKGDSKSASKNKYKKRKVVQEIVQEKIVQEDSEQSEDKEFNEGFIEEAPELGDCQIVNAKVSSDDESPDESEATTKAKKKKGKSRHAEKTSDNEDEIPQLVYVEDKEVDASGDSEGSLHEELAAWSRLHVPTEVLRALKENGFIEPTPIQVAAIPVAIRDRLDVLGAAETGSGKTLAFGIPLINFIINDRLVDPSRKLRGLILTPTRELAVQIKSHIDRVSKYADVYTMCLVGGLSLQKQERILRDREPDIVVATPGRLWEVIDTSRQSHLSRQTLRELRFLVIDEADRMTEKGHFDELTQVIEVMNSAYENVDFDEFADIEEVREEDLIGELNGGKVSANGHVEEIFIDPNSDNDDDEELSVDEDGEERAETDQDEDAQSLLSVDNEDKLGSDEERDEAKAKVKRQILVFSATLTLLHELPKRIKFDTRKKRRQSKQTVENKLRQLMAVLGMRLDASKVVDLTQQGVGRPNQEFLKEAVIMCPKNEKDIYLYYFLSLFPGRSIVFCNSKDCLRRLVSVLRLFGLEPLAMHGEMDQKKRLVALEKFTAVPGKGLLLASDVAARGLDITGVDHVIHYQCPRTSESYVHRSGRTARALSKGVTLILVDPSESFNYSKLCNSVNDGNHFHSFPIEFSVLKTIRQRVELAQDIDVVEHRVRKICTKSDWFRKAAREMEIDLEGRDDLLEDVQEESKIMADRSRLKGMKKDLTTLLKVPLGVDQKQTLKKLISTANEEPITLSGAKTALEAIEGVEKKKMVKLDIPMKPLKPRKEKKPKYKNRKRK